MTIDPQGQVTMNVDIVEQHGGENLIYGTIAGVSSSEGEPQESASRARRAFCQTRMTS